jgi:D-hydroxyproline dehydrogenase subunit beta
VAVRLAAAGARVTLLDQDEPGRATSRWSFAWLNSNDKSPRAYHDLNHAGIRAWAELAPGLDGDAWYRPAGHVELATDSTELEARVKRLTSWDYPARLVDAAEAARLEPALRIPPGATSAFFPEEGYLLTEPLIARLVAQAKRHGAHVLTREPGRVTSLEPGAPPRVRTAAGAILEADEVICCAGRWTPALTGVPLVPWDTTGSEAPGLAVRVGPVAPPGPSRLIHTPELSLRPHPGGLLHLEAPDAADAVDLHTPEAELSRWAAELLDRARRTVRGLDHARVAGYKVCVRPLPPDGQSIVGRLPGAPGRYVAVTHSGVTLAAHLSRLIAADLTTGTPPTGLAPYRPGRFGPPPVQYLSRTIRVPAPAPTPRHPDPGRPGFQPPGQTAGCLASSGSPASWRSAARRRWAGTRMWSAVSWTARFASRSLMAARMARCSVSESSMLPRSARVRLWNRPISPSSRWCTSCSFGLPLSSHSSPWNATLAAKNSRPAPSALCAAIWSMSPSSRDRSASVTRGMASRTAITSSASRT